MILMATDERGNLERAEVEVETARDDWETLLRRRTSKVDRRQQGGKIRWHWDPV